MQFIDNSGKFLAELERAKKKALKTMGLKAEGYAKKLCPVDTGILRDSIAHRVQGDVLELGSDAEYAPYVELGTGPHFVPPPEWERFESEKGKGVGKVYVKPRPYIRPAIEEHRDEYKHIAERELKGG